MKHIVNLLFLVCALAPVAAIAYQKADSVEAAQSKVKDDGYAVFTYAEGWDKHSKKTARNMMEHAAVRKALGNAVVMTLGVPNITTKEQHEANAARFGKFDLSFPNSYPAIIFYDKNGYRYAEVCISFDERKKPKAVAKRIREVMEGAAKQREIMAKAEAASGVEKARLLGQASAIPGIRKPDRVAQRIKEADPEDKSRMLLYVNLNLPHKAIATADTKDWKATLEEIKGLMQHPMMTTENQQQLCCICIGLLHRHGGPEHMGEMKALIKKLRELDPDSMLGKSAIDARRLWVKELSLADGWSPQVLPADTKPVEVAGPLPIKAAGTYEVTFTYMKGNHAATIEAVELYDGSTKVAEDRHKGSAGINHSNNVYTLQVPSALKKPRLMVSFNMGQNRNSYGSITVSAR